MKTIENYLEVTLNGTNFNLRKNNEQQITEITFTKSPNSGVDFLQQWNVIVIDGHKNEGIKKL